MIEDPLAGAAASFECRFLDGADGWKLRVLSWTPLDEEAAGRSPVLVVPGWTSVVEGWQPLLAAWADRRPLHYIETREKNDARSPAGHREVAADFAIPTHARDLAAVAGRLGVDGDGDWFASSLGSTTLLEGFRSGTLEARAAFLLAPNARFELPWWVSALSSLPWWVYPPLIRFLAIPYMRWRVKEEGQRIRYCRTLRRADVRRLKRSTQANRRYIVWTGLESVQVPCAVCVAESDGLHAHGDALRIAEMLPNSTVIEVESNQFAHEAAAVPLIENWFAGATVSRSAQARPRRA